MADHSQYAELARHLTALGIVRRAVLRALPPEWTAGSVAVLSLLAHQGEMRMSKVSELLGVDVSTASRHVAHAAEHGWLDRVADPSDGRSRILRLTPQGRAVLDEAARHTVELFARTLAGWSDDDVDRLNGALARLYADFDGCRTCHTGSHGHPPAPAGAAAAAL